ncbi:uncharacterized protein MELLADRAFT_84255 [Melampsora larici-populina 98AG31]|uniref:Uncharacterized protein n=1 Tax=Melampsora larici-populina (strain 98AG31 / pathotype 3-4-7) TaxID=747676 RepID=F4RF24_MELLP|nr:uncharacterized protein MELLADRAFT_84255 [Melampsora larici-populina 98AG31]EGG09011.1 hypothetical protein MELLADRAFT_84255 [Melampsora larici-populina 98AG31]
MSLRRRDDLIGNRRIPHLIVKFPTSNLLNQRQNESLRGASKSSLVKTVGKPAQSATQVHQRWVEKLLPKYHNCHESTNFLDKRFGEGDSSLTLEEKSLERFTKEHQMRLPGGAKRNIFNLDNDPILLNSLNFKRPVQRHRTSSRSPSPEANHGDKDKDMYDRFVRQLAFDPRTKPSDRLKTADAPTSHAYFLSIVSQQCVKSAELPTVVQHIRVLYQPSLGEDDKSKLTTFTNVLIDHVIHTTSLHK